MKKKEEEPCSDTLKRLGLTDDEILDVVCEARLLTAAKRIRYALIGKWNIPMLTAIEVVKKLKAEFNEE